MVGIFCCLYSRHWDWAKGHHCIMCAQLVCFHFLSLAQEGRIAVFAAQNDEITALVNFYGTLFASIMYF